MPKKPLPPALRRPVGRPAIYPWNFWLNGDSHNIRPGDDFDCTLDSMRAQLYERARAAGFKVSVRRSHDGLMIRADRATSSSAPAAKYDWDKLLDGKVHQLRAGVDFTSKPNSFRVYARTVAAERGAKVSIKAMGDSLFLQAILPGPDLSGLPLEMEGF